MKSNILLLIIFFIFPINQNLGVKNLQSKEALLEFKPITNIKEFQALYLFQERLKYSLVNLDSSLSNEKDNFTNQTDPIFNTLLNEINSTSLVQYVVSSLDGLHSNWKASKKMFLNGDVKLAKYLTSKDGIRKNYEEDLKILNEQSGKEIKNIGGEYNIVLLVLHEIHSEIPSLMDNWKFNSDSDNIELFCKAYVKIKSLNRLIKLFEEVSESKLLLKFNIPYPENLKELLVENRRLKECLRSKGKTDCNNVIKQLKENQNKIEGIINKFSRELINKNASEHGTYLDSINLKFNKQLKKGINFFNQPKKGLSSEFVDIKDNNNTVWTRIRFSTQIAPNLLNSKESIIADGMVSIVYKPNISSKNNSINRKINIFSDAEKLLNEVTKEKIKLVNIDNKLTQKQKNDSIKSLRVLLKNQIENNKFLLETALQNFQVEIPTGLTVKDIKLKTNKNGNYKFKTNHGGTVEYISINKPTITSSTIWPKFNTDIKIAQEFVNKLQLSKSLGITLSDVSLDSTLQAKLFFKWQPQDFLKTILNDIDSTKTIVIDINKIKVEDTIDFKKQLQKSIANSIAQKVEMHLKIYEKPRSSINNYLPIEAIESISVSSDEIGEGISGSFIIKPVGYEIFVSKFPEVKDVYKTKLEFNTGFKNDKAFLKVNIDKIDISVFLKPKIDSLISTTINSLEFKTEEELKNTALGIQNKVSITNANVDLVKKYIKFDVSIINIGNLGTAIINQEGLDIKLNKKYLESYAKNFLLEEISKNIDCESLKNSLDSLFGLPIKIESDCDLKNPVIDAVVTQKGYEHLKFKFGLKNNKLKLIDYPKKEVEKLLISRIKKILPKGEYYKLKNPKIEDGNFIIDLWLTIPTLKINEKVSLIKIDPFSGKPPSIEGLELSGIIEDKLKEGINKTKGFLPFDINFGDQRGIKLTKLEDLKLKEGVELLFSAEVNLHKNIKFKCEVSLKESGKFIPEFKNIKYDEKMLLSFLPDINTDKINGILKFNPIRFEGNIKFNIDALPIPPINFTLTKDKFDFTFDPEIEIKGAFQAGPLVILDPTFKLDFKQSEISTNAFMTVGVSESARETAKLVKLYGEIGFSYKNVGDFRSNSELVLLNFMPVMQGVSEGSLKNLYFKMDQSTVGKMREILEFNASVEFDGKNRILRANGKVDLLNVISADARLLCNYSKKDFLALEFEAKCNLPIGDFGVEGKTKMKPINPLSALNNAELGLNLKSKFEILGVDFNTGAIIMKVKPKNTKVNIELLGINLGINIPSPYGLDGDDIKDLILGLLDFDLSLKAKIDASKIKLDFSGLNIGFDKPSLEVKINLDMSGEDDGGKEGNGDNEKKAFEITELDNGDNNVNNSILKIQNSKEKQIDLKHIQTIIARQKKYSDCWKIGPFKIKCRTKYRTIREELFKTSNWLRVYGNNLPEDFGNYSCIYDTRTRVSSTGYKIEGLTAPINQHINNIFQVSRIDKLVDKGYSVIYSDSLLLNKLFHYKINILSFSKKDVPTSNKLESNFSSLETEKINPNIYNINIIYKNSDAYAFLSVDPEKLKSFVKNNIIKKLNNEDDFVRSKILSKFKNKGLNDLNLANKKLSIVAKNIITYEVSIIKPFKDENTAVKALGENEKYKSSVGDEKSIKREISQTPDNSHLVFVSETNYNIKHFDSLDVKIAKINSKNDLSSYKKFIQNRYINSVVDNIDTNLFPELKYKKKSIDKNILIKNSAQNIIDKIANNNFNSGYLIFEKNAITYVPNQNSNFFVEFEDKSNIDKATQKEYGSLISKSTGVVFEKINITNLKLSFKDVYSADISDAEFLTKVKKDINKYNVYRRLQIYLNEMIQSGGTPYFINAQISKPKIELQLWNNKEAIDFFITENVAIGDINLNPTSFSYFQKKSDIADKLGVNTSNLETVKKELETNNSLYFNHFIYKLIENESIKNNAIVKDFGNPSNKVYLKIEADEVIIGELISVEEDFYKYSLISISDKVNYTLYKNLRKEYEDKSFTPQLYLSRKFNSSYSIEKVASDVSNSSKFFDLILEPLLEHKKNKAYIQSTQNLGENYRYKALLFIDGNIKMVWEQNNKNIKPQVIHLGLVDNIKKILEIASDPSRIPRLVKTNLSNLSDSQLADFILSSLESTDDWNRIYSIINPLVFHKERVQ
ncbi:hypothetical protein IMCC3317_17750 [Kordia antarctica]|uniref:Uncharacterized protein n=1 Tax=Kordia antarctica TaxID=1218801 RepID=A0A7L4ZIE7_9FLAO|nr:hypothetical protein [Kordia antarctica]QHI36412.1 hypothetical protein IMCC3317_17750 [Kordia antarctica]